MDFTRRDLSLLLPFLTAQILEAAKPNIQPSAVYSFESLPVTTDPKTGAEYRQVFTGVTHNKFLIDLHITTMPPGQMPHPPHQHVHEEMMLIQTGSLEVTISEKKTIAGPGSVIYIHSNDEHGLKSVGQVPAQYFVLALGKK